MMGEEIIIVAIVFGSIFGIVALGILSSIVKTWIKNKGNKSIVNDEEFLSALREFKQKTDRRLANLEAIVTNEEFNPVKSESGKKAVTADDQKKVNKKKQSSVIEIEEKESDSSSKTGNLRNALKE
ncbi:MAG: hypothetical protein ACFCU6_05270 [Balneolaceae bacterium]